MCQLAYIDLSSGEPEGGNFFFTVDDMNEYAREVHGFTISMLEHLSGGKRFADHAGQVKELLGGKCVVGHSVACDVHALREEFVRCSIRFDPARQFCTMTHFRPIMNIPVCGSGRPKEPSLSEVCKYINVTDEAACSLSTALYGDSTRRHDARYDVCATYLCALAAQKAGMVRGLFPKGW